VRAAHREVRSYSTLGVKFPRSTHPFIRTREGWLYLAAILDVFNRQIVGWSIDSKLSHELLADALRKALRNRKPERGVMFHSDRGTQYASYAFRDLMERYGFVQSMSSSGNCYDNALMESFFHTLKTELIYFEKYQTRQEARGSIFESLRVIFPEACFAWRVATNHEIPRSLLRGGSFVCHYKFAAW
jgi:transposase InsO family protein